MIPSSSKMIYKTPYFWPRFWLLLAGLHPIVVGILLLLRDLFFSWPLINLQIPSPRLYGDVSAAFLISIGVWLIFTAYKYPDPGAVHLWIIPAGSALGRVVYFSFTVVGLFNRTNEFIYFLLGLSDVLFAIILLWVTYIMRKTLK
ncbi:MAG: hypothetical protein ACFFFG_15970 [Candidatus Thorarchaeota archaeon]